MPDELPELDPVVHGKLRLAALSLLIGVEKADFTWLRDKTGSTDGNLGAQMLKLKEAGYVAMKKRFVGRKPQTPQEFGRLVLIFTKIVWTGGRRRSKNPGKGGSRGSAGVGCG
jgi:DNA-binding transcriptional ArsR family regulator